jgi:hypothetical protein
MCEDISPSVAWNIVKAMYEERDSADEPIWVYIDETETRLNHLRETEAAFCITYTDSIRFLKDKFELALKQAKEG